MIACVFACLLVSGLACQFAVHGINWAEACLSQVATTGKTQLVPPCATLSGEWNPFSWTRPGGFQYSRARLPIVALSSAWQLGLAGSRGDWTCQGGILAMGFQHCALADILEHALGCLADDENVSESPWSWDAYIGVPKPRFVLLNTCRLRLSSWMHTHMRRRKLQKTRRSFSKPPRCGVDAHNTGAVNASTCHRSTMPSRRNLSTM